MGSDFLLSQEFIWESLPGKAFEDDSEGLLVEMFQRVNSVSFQ